MNLLFIVPGLLEGCIWTGVISLSMWLCSVLEHKFLSLVMITINVNKTTKKTLLSLEGNNSGIENIKITHCGWREGSAVKSAR